MSNIYTVGDVALHNKADDCWIIIDGFVYDVTKFVKLHPGGSKILLSKAGQDATKEFHAFHGPNVMRKYEKRLKIGRLNTTNDVSNDNELSNVSTIPYGDIAGLQSFKSPYYKESHFKLRKVMRQHIEQHIIPFCHAWDENRSIPKELFRKCAGWTTAATGPPWPVDYLGPAKIMGVVDPTEFDAFHELIIVDEAARCGSGGVVWAIFEGIALGLPPVRKFGIKSKELQSKCIQECINGEKVICLAITEPSAGSDVASLRTTATLSSDGSHYIVNGEKKWITSGMFADYFTVAVRTGGPGMGGLSLLLIEKDAPGFKQRQMKCSGVWPSGTAYLTFEDVKVPKENLIGLEGHGFKYIMTNFNHERWFLIVQTIRFARVCYEDSFRHAARRETFGKKMLDHPVIRWKLAEMSRQIEATQAWLDSVTYQRVVVPEEKQGKLLAGPIALLKVQATKTLEYCAREGQQILGGLGYTRGGIGERIERLSREVRAYSIPGGSEEIMLDFGMRQAIKQSKL